MAYQEPSVRFGAAGVGNLVRRGLAGAGQDGVNCNRETPSISIQNSPPSSQDKDPGRTESAGMVIGGDARIQARRGQLSQPRDGDQDGAAIHLCENVERTDRRADEAADDDSIDKRRRSRRGAPRLPFY